MIRKGKELRVAALIRQEIIDVYDSIEDADFYDRFSDPSPNWATKQRLRELISKFRKELCSLGALPITAHSPCGASKHVENDQYWVWILPDGRTNKDVTVDGRIVIDGRQMETDYQTLSLLQNPVSCDPCPCNPRKRAKEHRILQFLIWPQNEESKIRELAKLIPELTEAMEKAEERKTRSSIRESLLLALIDLERLIVNVTASEEIERRKTPKK